MKSGIAVINFLPWERVIKKFKEIRMNVRKLFLAVSVSATAMVSMNAMADPTAWIDVGTSGYTVRATNQSDTRYLCSYTVKVTFKDGTTANYNGQSAPPTGGTNSNVAELNIGRPVSSATLTGWSCQKN